MIFTLNRVTFRMVDFAAEDDNTNLSVLLCSTLDCTLEDYDVVYFGVRRQVVLSGCSIDYTLPQWAKSTHKQQVISSPDLLFRPVFGMIFGFLRVSHDDRTGKAYCHLIQGFDPVIKVVV